jgi:hypothetical protein
VKPTRDHLLPPDPEAYRRADHPHGRVIVIAPTRAACETIELALHTRVETLLQREHGAELEAWVRGGKAFGIVAGTGTGKTLGIRPIAEALLQEPLQVAVVNREREATPETAACNVVIVTTGIARRWLTDDLIARRDTIVVDEIHQTSAELELCLALGKRVGCRFIWLSATVDPAYYRRYLDSDEVLETSAFDPRLAAKVSVIPQEAEQFLDDRQVRRFISERRGVAVFLPTRAEVERLGAELGSRFPRLATAFYHGGEPIRIIRPFLEGAVPKPFLLAMTAAGQSALNLPGLDTVVIEDARYGNLVDRGRNVLHRLHLGANEILQMAGRVHGRVAGGEVYLLTDRPLDFATLRPAPPDFQLAGDAERVALTCAEIGVDAGDLDLPVPLDRGAYRRAVAHLTDRGVIAEGRLTAYGRQVEALPVERSWAELLIHADADLLPVVAGASGIDSLHRMTRDERELHGVLVSGSDHLTAYNALAEAVNQFSTIADVHGLRRHVFEEEGLAEWAERRGILVKAVEDGALAMASVYRSLDLQLPAVVPRVHRALRDGFVNLVARVMPFDLVIDEETADGQPVRISRTSVAGSWGAVAGAIRFFADRFGVPRASVEGTTIPYDTVRQYASWGPPRIAVVGIERHRGLGIARRLRYFGFELETEVERLDGDVPAELREDAITLLAGLLLTGEIEHPWRTRVGRAVRQLDEYRRRAGGDLPQLERDALLGLLREQLREIHGWDDFQRARVELDVGALVAEPVRRRLDALPTSVRVAGDASPLEYDIVAGRPVVRLQLREGQARRLRAPEIPVLDRPVLLTVRGPAGTIEATTPAELQRLLREAPRRRAEPRGRERRPDPKGRRGPRGRRRRR